VDEVSSARSQVETAMKRAAPRAVKAEPIQDYSRPRWWGEFEIPHGQAGLWRIGPLSLTVARHYNEWRVFRTSVGEQHDAECSFQLVDAPDEPGAGAVVTRYAAADAGETLTLRPLLPDKPVVTRPENPINILARQKLTIYVGSPLWVVLEAGVPLGELPLQPPKLTWWGANTREGELCYSSHTKGRLRLEEAARYPHRVMTPVLVHNDTDEPLSFDSLNLPVRRLSVYVGRDGRLWTEGVSFERSAWQEFAVLKIDEDEAPATNTELISVPRDADREHFFFRAFGSLFG
jgi:hypothetical protein